jgi:hypothetical protein
MREVEVMENIQPRGEGEELLSMTRWWNVIEERKTEIESGTGADGKRF